jgi:pimeloyl-ACP methyl ester carboxylesterase
MTVAASGRRRPNRAWRAALAGGAALAGLAGANILLARRAERRRPPRGRFVTVDGVRVHYLERGEGPPIMLLHGNGATAEDFAVSGLLDALAADHRVVAFDRPGFGHTARPRGRRWTAVRQAELLVAAAAAIGLDRPIVVGHSWGAAAALTLALEGKAEIAGLVLISGYYRPTPRADALVMSAPALPLVGDAVRYTVSPPLGRLMAPAIFKLLFSPAPVTAAFRAEFPMDLALRPWQLRATAADTAYMVPDAARASSRLDRLHVPVLIIAGEGDRIVSAEHQACWLAERLPQAHLVLLRGGHMIHHTAPREVAEAIEAFAVAHGPDARRVRELAPALVA